MAARKSQRMVTGGRLWGNERVRLGVSLRALADESKVPKGSLSLMEHGRLIPTSDEYDAVTRALTLLAAFAPTPPPLTLPDTGEVFEIVVTENWHK